MASCWNGLCVSSYCDGIGHVDATGASWSERRDGGSVEAQTDFESKIYTDVLAWCRAGDPNGWVDPSYSPETVAAIRKTRQMKINHAEDFALWFMNAMRDSEDFAVLSYSSLWYRWLELIGMPTS